MQEQIGSVDPLASFQRFKTAILDILQQMMMNSWIREMIHGRGKTTDRAIYNVPLMNKPF